MLPHPSLVETRGVHRLLRPEDGGSVILHNLGDYYRSTRRNITENVSLPAGFQ
jgi:hypothetical protein